MKSGCTVTGCALVAMDGSTSVATTIVDVGAARCTGDGVVVEVAAGAVGGGATTVVVGGRMVGVDEALVSASDSVSETASDSVSMSGAPAWTEGRDPVSREAAVAVRVAAAHTMTKPTAPARANRPMMIANAAPRGRI